MFDLPDGKYDLDAVMRDIVDFFVGDRQLAQYAGARCITFEAVGIGLGNAALPHDPVNLAIPEPEEHVFLCIFLGQWAQEDVLDQNKIDLVGGRRQGVAIAQVGISGPESQQGSDAQLESADSHRAGGGLPQIDALAPALRDLRQVVVDAEHLVDT